MNQMELELRKALESIGFKPRRSALKDPDHDEDGEDSLERHQRTESWQGRYV